MHACMRMHAGTTIHPPISPSLHPSFHPPTNPQPTQPIGPRRAPRGVRARLRHSRGQQRHTLLLRLYLRGCCVAPSAPVVPPGQPGARGGVPRAAGGRAVRFLCVCVHMGVLLCDFVFGVVAWRVCPPIHPSTHNTNPHVYQHASDSPQRPELEEVEDCVAEDLPMYVRVFFSYIYTNRNTSP